MPLDATRRAISQKLSLSAASCPCLGLKHLGSTCPEHPSQVSPLCQAFKQVYPHCGPPTSTGVPPQAPHPQRSSSSVSQPLDTPGPHQSVSAWLRVLTQPLGHNRHYAVSFSPILPAPCPVRRPSTWPPFLAAETSLGTHLPLSRWGCLWGSRHHCNSPFCNSKISAANALSGTCLSP